MTPKVEHQLLTAVVAKYGMKFLNEYAKHFKTIGGKSVIDPLENAKPGDNAKSSSSPLPPATAAEAMARFGHIR